jgi:hypothetical protein
MTEVFWSDFPDALLAAEQADDDDTAAATLIEFLEVHKDTWAAIKRSMRASAGRRAMIERALLILAERTRHDETGLRSGR